MNTAQRICIYEVAVIERYLVRQDLFLFPRGAHLIAFRQTLKCTGDHFGAQ